MISPEAEALRTRIKQLMRSTLPLEAPLATRRVQYEAVMSRGQLPASVLVEAVTVGTLPAEWVSAPEAASDQVMLYLHGGGYTMGSCSSHRLLAAALAQVTGLRLLVLDYRLAPEHPFPAALEDATAAYRWLLAEGYKPAKIVIAGDSAGGGLTLAALVALRDSGQPMPAGAVPISPWTDLEGTGESVRSRAARDPMVSQDNLASSAKQYYGTHDPKNPLISPLHANFRGLPPMLIHVGDAEILLDDATRVAERAKAAGVDVELEVWDDMMHVWHVFAKLLPEAQQAIDKIGKFVITRTS